MLLREKSRVTPLLYLLMMTPSLAWAQAPGQTIITGNAVAKPEAIERVVRMAVADVMNGEFSGVGLSFKTHQIDQSVDIPVPTGDLKEILSILGIKNTVNVSLAPIEAKFVLPASALKITIQKLQPNRFQVNAKWSITQLTASSPKLAIKVPKGVFDQGFDIVSSPLQIGLAPKSKPITIELNLLTDLTEKGTKIHLVSLATNINAATAKPDFFIKLGKLTVNGKPLEVEITTNGKKLLADEATIRAQFQQLEPSLVQTIRTKMKDVVQDQFSKIADEIEGEAPLKFKIDSNDLIQKFGDKPVIQDLFGDLSVEFMLSYLQYVDKYKVFSGQVTSAVHFDRLQYLWNSGATSAISTDDLKAIGTGDDIGIMVYESWLQNVVHSDLFQKRILDYYNKNKSPGTSIGKDGVKLHFDPARNAIVIVINLEIDIKKTGGPDSSFGKRLKNGFGDAWENIFGSGKLVKVPVEITAKITGVQKDATGKSVLVITPERPLQNGTFANHYHYTSNVNDMTSLVKSSLLDEVDSSICDTAAQKEADQKKKDKNRVKPVLCEGIGQVRIPLDVVDIKGYKFQPKKVTLTPNRGLLVTAEMKN
jgi:hypothetical protein